ncbi:MAG: hypothetical protein LW809_07570 [Vampirovibrionales bacterium]|jgi:hypothetical protein|nr:hypothetical protein [Vampirovibrionales bacterium]
MLGLNAMTYYDSLSQQKDLEYQKSLLSQRRKNLININSSLRFAEAKLDPNSEGYKALDMRVQQMEQMSQVLDAEAARIDMQLNANLTLMQSTKQMLAEDIKDSFTLTSNSQ